MSDPVTPLRRVLHAVRGALTARTLAFCVAAGLILRAYYDLKVRFAYEASGPMCDDAPIFAAIGRGLVNHVPLYTGLYETKPPVIFFLFALSLKSSETLHLVTRIELACLAAIALFPVALVLRHRRRFPYVGWRLAAALLAGSALALFTADRSGELEVELFGTAFLIPWIWVWSKPTGIVQRRLWIPMLVGGASLAVASLTKEPFFLVAVAVGLMNVRSREDARDLVLMIGAGGLIAMLLLLATGTFGAYFRVYLPEVIANPTYSNTYSDDAFSWNKVASKAFDWERFHDAVDWAPASAFVLAGAALAVMREQRASGELWFSILARWGFGTILVSFAIAITGKYYPHHFVFMVPWMLGIVAMWLIADGVDPMARGPAGFGSALAALALAAVTLDHARPDPKDKDLKDKTESMQREIRKAEASAKAVDDALDCMGETRYVFLGKNGFMPWGWTKHSPVGPFFFQYSNWFDEKRRAHRDILISELAKSRLLVFQSYSVGDFDDEIESLVESRFRPGLPEECSKITISAPFSFEYAPDH